MTALSRVRGWFRTAAPAAPAAPAASTRAYSAGEWSRLTSGWSGSTAGINDELFRSLRTMRQRSRELVQGDPFARKFLQMIKTNVIGPNGIRLQSTAGEIGRDGKIVADDLARALIERRWREWGRRGVCELSGRFSWVAFQALYISVMARDGEVLVRRLRGRDYGAQQYALQMIDIDRLDEQYNDEMRNGNKVRMSVELDALGRPVAYHVLKSHPREWSTALGNNPNAGERERVPAGDIYHDFVADSPEQLRGVPWMHAAMARLHHLSKFDDAAVIAARVGASELGVLQSPNGDVPSEFVDAKADGQAAWKFYMDVEPGKYRSLPPGYELKDIPRPYPEAAYADFHKACLRGVASGFNVAYNSLGSDLEGVNYSSIRQGVLEERDSWAMIQRHIADGFLPTVGGEWLALQLLTGGLNLPAAKLAKFAGMDWQARRWSWVDPMRDMQAAELAISIGVKSRTRIIAEQGDDREDIFAELAAEQSDAAALQLNVSGVPAAPVKVEGVTE